MHAYIIALAFVGGCLMPAQQTQRYGVGGLYTSPNPKLKAKDGALLRADEVILRRPGLVEPRPGFELSAVLGYGEAQMDALLAMLPFDGEVLYVGDHGGDVETFWSGAHVTTEDGSTELSWDRGSIRGKEARKNFYLTTSDAVRKLESSTDQIAARAGLPVTFPVILVNVTTGGPIKPSTQVAYRTVVRYTDSNGLIVRSAASGRATLNNDDPANAVTPSISVYWSPLDPPPEGSLIELYRTKGKGTTPSDEMFLAYTAEVTSTVLLAERVQFLDEREDADLERQLPLYSSPNREGTDRENIRPPRARDLELFQGSLFAAQIKFPHYMQLKWDEHEADLAGELDGIGIRTVTGDLETDSADIENVSDVTGLEVGMLVQLTPFSFAGTGPVRITAIVGSTVTVSEEWGGANTPSATMMFIDSVRIGNEYFAASLAFQLVYGITTDNSDWMIARTVPSDEVTARAIGNSYEYVMASAVPGAGARRVVRLERALLTEGAFAVHATHGDEYDPPLPLPTESGAESTQDDFANGLTWSKNDQPEHFMPDRKWLVGNQRSPILRIIKARETLWILKGQGDGIYALTGFGERTGWTVTQRDADTYLLHPDLAVAYDDAVYAWTNKGLVRITDAGVSAPLSTPIANLTADLEQTLVHDAEAADEMPCAFAVGNADEVIFGLPAFDFEDDAAPVSDVFVYHVAGERWSKWFAELGVHTCAAFDPASRLLMFGRSDAGKTNIERAATDPFRNADEMFAVTIASIDTATNRITISGGSDWDPAEGDALYKTAGAVFGIVTDVISPTIVEMDSVTGFAAGSVLALVAVDVRFKWLPEVGSGGGVMKRFHSNVLHWDEVLGVARWGVVLESSTNPNDEVEQTYDRELGRDEDYPERDDTRALFTREVSWGTQLYQGVHIRQADSRWRIAGVSTNYRPVSARPSR